jgi:hypothetical protein
VPSADTAFALVHDLLGEPPSCSTQDWTPPPHDVHNTIASAVAFQEHFADHMPTLVCAVCAEFCCPADVDRVAIDRLPHVHLLRADGPKTPSTPRHGHTTVRIADIVYCLHPNGVDRQHARVCKRCVSSLKDSRIPEASLVRFDAGTIPSHLPPLTFVEELVVAPCAWWSARAAPATLA